MRASSTSSASGTALVTGASSGIGKAVARVLADRGLTVFGTCRDPGALKDGDRVPHVVYLPLEITDPDSVRACVKEAGPVDVLINNAGRSQLGPLEDVPQASLEELFAVNVWGPVRLTRACLPGMRQAGGGTVVMVGSLMAEFPAPFHSGYAASKLALRGFAQSLRLEVAPFGIRVSVVQPGYFRSEINRRRERVVLDSSPYAAPLAAVSRVVDASHARAGDPSVVAERIWRIVRERDPAPVHSVGTHAATLLALKRLLPARGTERLLARRFRLPR